MHPALDVVAIKLALAVAERAQAVLGKVEQVGLGGGPDRGLAVIQTRQDDVVGAYA